VVAVAIPGIFLSLIFSAIRLDGAGFLASGVELLLGLMWTLVDRVSLLPFASTWISRPALVSCLLSCALVSLLFSASPWLRARIRKWLPPWQLLPLTAVVGILVAPVANSLALRGSIEIVVLDVGQGDATLIRSPRGRWVLVDAGPRTESFDAGERRVLPYLRKRGIAGLELVILTHPDMDHVGGAAAILHEVPVTSVLGPGIPAGTEVFIDALAAAAATERPWATVRAGDSLNLDGMALRVLAPEDSLPGLTEEGNNAASVVLEIRFGSFSALLMGDAPGFSEDLLLPRVLSDRVQLLKVGHHGSSTSTGKALLGRIKPEVALVSAGRRNRFGHPHSAVLTRLRRSGVEVFRTDQHGSLSVRARWDGSSFVSTEFQ
jgi:competence protein ComEC